MIFSNYEKAEGWSKGQPEVLVHAATIKEMGMPVVNHDALEDLALYVMQSSVEGLSVRVHPIQDRAMLGYYMAYSRKIHVDGAASERLESYRGGAVSTVAHEWQHLADYINRPLRTGAETIAIKASLLGKAAACWAASVPFELLAAETNTSIERRAYARGADKRVMEHQQDILFPNSPRTASLLYSRQLATDTIVKLGLNRSLKYASDYVKPKSWLHKIFSRD